jgi:hypothetical protein
MAVVRLVLLKQERQVLEEFARQVRQGIVQFDAQEIGPNELTRYPSWYEKAVMEVRLVEEGM